ncbi:MAG: hypothetical protein ABSH39_10640 [Candidatus Acidiferrum sp.]|jgi:plasmid stability protein
MKTKLRNITIALEEDVARWVRVEAATHDTSVSRLLANILKERMAESGNGKAAESAPANKAVSKSEGQYLSPDEMRVLSPENAAKLADIRAITSRIAALDKGPFRDHAEMLYDEHGLPK